MRLPSFLKLARNARPFDSPGFSGGAGFSWRAVAMRCRYEVERAALGEPGAIPMLERWRGLPLFRNLLNHEPIARQFWRKIAYRLDEAAQSERTCWINAFGLLNDGGGLVVFRLIALHLPSGIAVTAVRNEDERTPAELYARRPWAWIILPHNERSAKRQRELERERRKAQREASRPKRKKTTRAV